MNVTYAYPVDQVPIKLNHQSLMNLVKVHQINQNKFIKLIKTQISGRFAKQPATLIAHCSVSYVG